MEGENLSSQGAAPAQCWLLHRRSTAHSCCKQVTPTLFHLPGINNACGHMFCRSVVYWCFHSLSVCFFWLQLHRSPALLLPLVHRCIWGVSANLNHLSSVFLGSVFTPVFAFTVAREGLNRWSMKAVKHSPMCELLNLPKFQSGDKNSNCKGSSLSVFTSGLKWKTK